jgi:hypothetical protein
MPITVTDKIVALLASLTDDQIQALPPVQRRRLSDQCLMVSARCAVVPRSATAKQVPDRQQPSVGVLADLKRGVRSD